MRPGSWSFLFALLLLPLDLQAEQTPPAPSATVTAEQAQIDALKQRLATSEQQREALGAELQASGGERDSAQLQRLRQENQRLKLQLKKTQANTPAPLLADRQQWFAVGAGAALLGVILGALLRGNRRSRREWIN
ncbi:translation initiation factor 2 [Pseudomonas sp. sp1636]|uniref:translation initiation factor 2 n=1 Tax=Pseudomonas sp. sp1636 TaxID=3036707 RepID=UPI0025A5F06F|nr:translation initiation factor 2 [Pseudomonas sp. sp1636]MDM8350172.1 translation initiation factor 2 [Pseudomonas sp. sp1636]